jgi:photosystem II stability/assembly factor-like uncharacterized protein
MITRLLTDPGDADLLYATVANVGHSHVFRSRDGGRTWGDSDKGQLPDVPHHAIAIASDSDTLFVANDVGVFASTDRGATWANLSLNLPHTMFVDLIYQRSEGTLYAASYGRSVWRLQLKPL